MNTFTDSRKPESDTAYLSADDGFTVFAYGTRRIRFRAPYSLERYTNIKQWDNDGYLVVDAKYKHNTSPEEEYIDLQPVLTDLYIDADRFLGPIKKVKIAHD